MIKQYVEMLLLMSSAHVPIFCRKQLLEKVKVRFFIGVSQCTLTVLLSQTKDRTYLKILTGLSFGTHDPIFLLCSIMAGDIPWLDYVTRTDSLSQTNKAYVWHTCFVKNLDKDVSYHCSNTYQSSV